MAYRPPVKHEFILRPKDVTDTALGLLEQDLILAGLCYKNSAFDFHGALGDVVNVLRPSRAIPASDIGMLPQDEDGWRDDAPDRRIRVGHVRPTTFPVKLDNQPLNAVDVSDEQLTLDIEGFGAEILQPQTRGMAEWFDNKVATVMRDEFVNGTTSDITTVEADLTNADTGDSVHRARIVREAIIDARQALNYMSVPSNGRYILATPKMEGVLLKDPEFIRVDFSGDTSALRNATIGNLFGFAVVISNVLQDIAGDNAMLALHPTAIVLCTQAPVVPRGAVYGSSQSANGIAVRWLMDYDANRLSDRSILSTYCGITPVPEDPWAIDKYGVVYQRVVNIKVTDTRPARRAGTRNRPVRTDKTTDKPTEK